MHLDDAVERLYVGYFHGLLGMRNGPCSHYSPVKIPFKNASFYKQKQEAPGTAAPVLSAHPPFIACLRAGFQDAQSIGSTQRNLLKLGKEKCPGNAEPVHNFLQKKKSLSPKQSLMQILQVGCVCIRCAVLLNKKTQPNKKQAQLPSSALQNHPSDTSVSEVLQTSLLL